MLRARHARGRLQHGVPAIRGELVRAEDAEIARRGVELHDVAHHRALDPRRLGLARPGLLDRHGVLAEIGQPQLAEQRAAVRVRVVAHATLARRRERLELGSQTALGGEELLRAIALHPLFQLTQVLGLLGELGERHLVRPPGPLDRVTVDDARAGPALRAGKHEHRPARPLAIDPRTRARSAARGSARSCDRGSPPSRGASPGDPVCDRRSAARTRSPP